MSLSFLAFLAAFLAVGQAFDGSMRDSTGCPAVFQQKCNCTQQMYQWWHPERNTTYVVNCTNKR
jgi:hypothetical protein